MNSKYTAISYKNKVKTNRKHGRGKYVIDIIEKSQNKRKGLLKWTKCFTN